LHCYWTICVQNVYQYTFKIPEVVKRNLIVSCCRQGNTFPTLKGKRFVKVMCRGVCNLPPHRDSKLVDLSITSGLSMGPIQLPIQWLSGVLSWL